MRTFDAVSIALFAATIIVAPVVGWSLMMYHELEATGLMIAALS